MNARIPPPQRPVSGQDVLLECEHAIDAAVRELVDQIITAGWPPKAAYDAIKRVADRQATAYQEDPDPAGDSAGAALQSAFHWRPSSKWQ